MKTNRDMLRKLTESDVTFYIVAHEETIPVRGNASAWDDEEANEQYANEIIERLESGDVWAWCIVEVIAQWEGFTGNDYLGGCSYWNEADFMQGGYYEDMKAQALTDLNRVKRNYVSVKPLIGE